MGRVRTKAHHVVQGIPSIEELLDVDREYREQAKAGALHHFASRRFNPTHEAWLPILHTQRGDRHYTALFSNMARAHQKGKTRERNACVIMKGRQAANKRQPPHDDSGMRVRTTDMPLVDMQYLTCEVEHTRILHDLTLFLEEQEIHALLGVNGSGKSRLAYVLMGCEGFAPIRGQMTFKGIDLGPLRMFERARLGMTLA